MSRYDIYGVGNAIVDYEVAVTESDLLALGLEKGVMTLVELSDLERYKDYFGDRLHERSGGGSAANTILGASQLGARCYYACKVSDDEDGQFYVQDLIRNGVDISPVSGDVSLMTGQCLVMITEDAERTMATYLGVTASLETSDIDMDRLQRSSFVYLEGYLVASESGRQAVISARKQAEFARVKTVLTLSDPNMVRYFKDELMDMIGEKVDVLFSNEDEALLFSDTISLDLAIPILRKISDVVVVTRGKMGALIVSDSGLTEVSGRSVTAVDTNGAGDLFAGAFLAALVQGKSLAVAGQWGVIASSELVTQFGARLTVSGVESVKCLMSGC